MKYINTYKLYENRVTGTIGPAPLREHYISYNLQPAGTLSPNGRFTFDETFYKENENIGIPKQFFIELVNYIKSNNL
jgi:hypothetical protein